VTARGAPALLATMNDWFRLHDEAAIPSPALLLFRERIEHNLRLMIDIAGGPARLRPHVKTHKLGPLVARQIELGITKFKASTIAETEMCAAAGAPDVLLAFPQAGPNIARLCELARRFSKTSFSVVADDPSNVRALSAAAVAAGVTLGVFIDLDCGMHRTGIAPSDSAVELYKLITQSPVLRAAGLHAYDGHIHEPDAVKRRVLCEEAFAPVLALRTKLEGIGLPVSALVAGGTPTFPIHALHTDRECSPGTTVLWDFGYGDKFPDLSFQHAAVLLARVVSKPTPDRLCLDLGHKAVAAENPHPRVRFFELPDAVAVVHSEEHLVLETPRSAEFAVGDVLHGIPRHICPTVALHAEALVVESGRVVETWPILARARRLTV
jgi:D-serine deaminase-like pyridoxal phosphate-dependent protein